MGKAEPAPNQRYTGEFKIEAVRLAGAIVGNPRFKRLGMPPSTIIKRVRRSEAGTLGDVEMAPATRPVFELEAQNARLRGRSESHSTSIGIDPTPSHDFVRPGQPPRTFH